MTKIRRLFSRRGWAYGLFWSWNVIFLAFMLLGFAPKMLPELLTAVQLDQVPPVFLAYAVILSAIPVVTVILGLTLLRGDPDRQFMLGYGVEGPLMLLVAIRFFAVRELTPPLAVLLIVAGLGIATYLWQLLDQKIDSRGAWLLYGRVAGLTLLLLAGLYASTWLAFYAVPLGVALGRVVIDFLGHLPRFVNDLWQSILTLDWREIQWGWLPFVVLGSILIGYTATLVVVMPIAVLILYSRAWWRGLQALFAASSRRWALGLSTAIVILTVLVFVLANRQPQQRAFALLEDTPATPTEAKALLDQQAAIRAGLLNAYLSPLRYFSAVGDVTHVREMYRHELKLSDRGAEQVQQLYETVAQPVLYMPVNPPAATDTNRRENRAQREESRQAAELYQNFFDQPIVEAEREAVIRAARSTWSIEQARTTWLVFDDREVHLKEQAVTISEHGDWAEVELYEVYQNQTGERQEVVYYFSLPESAVITGLWLGNGPDRTERFAYRVSPRGAAQAVYRNEVRYFRDPALVEQIGPRQYRLRVFPVQPQSRRWNDSGERPIIEEGPPLFMWLTYQVLAQDSAWPLPRLAEKRNVYWDKASMRLVNGQPLTGNASAWLPASIPATNPVEAVAHRVNFPGGKSVLVEPVAAADLPQPHANLNLAVVLDRSRSMANFEVEVKSALARLSELAEVGASVEVYLTASSSRGEEPSRVGLAKLDPAGIIYYGGQNAAELLVQFDTLQRGEAYDAVLVLTDGSGYEVGADGLKVPIPPVPVWMVHLAGNFPLGYDDGTLAAIQASGGGVAGSVDEALTRLAVALEAGQSESAPDVIDGYAWTTIPTQTAGSEARVIVHKPGDAFAAFAARRLILAEMQRQRGQLTEVETLDELHAIAVEHSVVTPYSSMIVLVNDQQRQLLKKLENREDRFQREYEEVGETENADPFEVTGVPEPEEWLLLGLAVGMLGWYVYSMRRQRQGQLA
jgi:putative PEP-CTERM system integral membrane protein